MVDDHGNPSLPNFPATVFLNGKSVQSEDRGGTSVERVLEVRFLGPKVHPSEDGQGLAVDAGIRPLEGETLRLKAKKPLKVSAPAGGLKLTAAHSRFVGDARSLKAYPAGTKAAMNRQAF